MSYQGTVILESLENAAVLRKYEIKDTEIWKAKNRASFQPELWTAHFIEVPEEMIDRAIKEFSSSLKEKWYMDFSSEKERCILFSNKVFRYSPGDSKGRSEAVEYGRSLGVPPVQLDWPE